MPSRPDLRERTQQDLDELLGQLAVLAKALLTRNGEFFPFGATIGKRGKFALITPVPESDAPTAHDVVDAILSELLGSRETIRACGIAAMAETESGADAVRIELEHAEGSSLVIALPYARGDFGAFAYGDMEARRVARRVWVAPPPAPPAKGKPSARPAAKRVDQGVLFDGPEAPAHAKPVDKRPKAAKASATPPKPARPEATSAPHRKGASPRSAAAKGRTQLRPQPA